MKYNELKSGTDIRGTAIGENKNLDTKIMFTFGIAFTNFVKDIYNLEYSDISISIGRDTRLTGEVFQRAFAEGISSTGAKAYIFGVTTTPSMYHCLIHNADLFSASAMITASHHPYQKNGIKFFIKTGGLNSNDIDKIINLANNININIYSSIEENIIHFDYKKQYVKDIKNIITNALSIKHLPLQGLKVLIDAGNGVGGFFETILKDLGADTSGSQFLEYDGNFPNHSPNPEDKEAMKSLSSAVIKNNADLGVIFDADGDRSAIVDNNGIEINRNKLIALLCKILSYKYKNYTIVTDSVTSLGLTKFINSLNCSHHRYKRGYRNVIDEAIRLNSLGINTPIAIETSGHCAFRDNFYLDDGMYTATLIIIEAAKLLKQGKLLSFLINDLEIPVEEDELRLTIQDSDFKTTGNNFLDFIKEKFSNLSSWEIDKDSYEGIRIIYKNEKDKLAFFIARLSVHDPVIAINIESDFIGGVELIKSSLYKNIKDKFNINTEALLK